MGYPLLLAFCYILLSSKSLISIAEDTLRPNQIFTNGRTLVSSSQSFELGFFTPGSSKNSFLGIWYKNILPQTVVWVANRNNPIIPGSSSASLSLGSSGFSISTNESLIVWSVNVSVVLNSPILQLLDNGNLILRDESGADAEGYVIWQSFDDITDTLLPEMKLGWNLVTGLNRNMTSWLSSSDPSAGEFTFSVDRPAQAPQLVVRKRSAMLYRWGPWDGVRFSGSNELKSNPVFTPIFNISSEEVYYTFELIDKSTLSRFVMNQDGSVVYFTWRASDNQWGGVVTLQQNTCDGYGICGPYGSCDSKGPSCMCLKGFAPKSPQEWQRLTWTGGCVRNWDLDCKNGDGFVRYEGLKLPDNSFLFANRSLSLKECEAECLKNCSCMAYTRIDIHARGGDCVMWFDELVDMRNYPDGGEEIYIRMARKELESIADAKKKKRVKVAVTIVLSSLSGMLIFGVVVCIINRIRKTKRRAERREVPYQVHREEMQEEDLELPILDFDSISAATDKFSIANKIGEGGFGTVYKGVLPSGQEIAVKRLSVHSGQGLREFKNEVVLIAKLQHRNLVKLLGCCIQREEKMLIYEYLPNKSLDQFLFDRTRKEVLTWRKRFDIVMGIARGLLYLHQDSRLRIIHRDLKASNILLDSEMKSKISDFGTARIFGGEQTEQMTRRVIGTYGYMSPEYAMSGHFSVKSDVFSFGVLVLEIISGRKNSGFHHPEHDLNLLGHAWNLWNEGNPLQLLDAQIEKSSSVNEVIRCIQVALLCVQQRMDDRPTMSTVLLMLSNENYLMPQPKEPGFITELLPMGDTSSSGKKLHTANDVTVTILAGR
ncbi:G-type lectin S-receptor-like serine/threonine-protein kinase At4g27290 isoform X2 [Rosa chinensis]|uniref:G-type lectin S-receptor-like serine/threonine-protein kinase At4g27290 isoform X2 n=1 Tax=Rosa chinensis TaxID=74649 RepID=UPI000D097879|nr:G-type lectin S-receptor-like serine/threonine-protein kinase At4g27290 isoform X2 [Rosa chinensis]